MSTRCRTRAPDRRRFTAFIVLRDVSSCSFNEPRVCGFYQINWAASGSRFITNFCLLVICLKTPIIDAYIQNWICFIWLLGKFFWKCVQTPTAPVFAFAWSKPNEGEILSREPVDKATGVTVINLVQSSPVAGRGSISAAFEKFACVEGKRLSPEIYVDSLVRLRPYCHPQL